MQIHEITRKQPVNEILGLAANLVGGIAKQAGKQFVQQFAPQLAPGDRVGTPQDRVGAMKVTQPIIDALVPQLQKAWQQSVQAFLANSKDSAGMPATSLKDVTSPSIDSLKNDLVTMINKMISPGSSGFTYQNLGRYVGDDPVAKNAAQEIITAINKNIETVFKATVDGMGSNAIKSAFVELVRDGIAPAQNSMAYDRGITATNKVRIYQDPSGRWIIDFGDGPEWLDKTKPEHKAALEKMQGGGL